MKPLPLIVLGEVDSTQAFLARHPELGFCGILASAQTEGRGRGSNRWESAPGAGLWFSARLPRREMAPGLVLQRAMVAVLSALEPWAEGLGLKWPNDLVAWHQGRLVKLGGIIGETVKESVTLGLGVNLGAAPHLPERTIPPACLRDLGCASLPDPQALALDLLNRWQDLGDPGEPAFLWPGLGDPVRWEDGEGTCEGWEVDGRLRVRTATGVQLLSSADLGLGAGV